VDRSPQEVFDAVTDVRGWWSADIDGGTAEEGDEFTYRYGEMHRCRIRLTEVVPGRRVTWLVLENHFAFTRDRTEWTGTTMTFDIVAGDGGTELRFTHHGLVPDYECFDVCTDAWSISVGGSLRNLITTGEGQPNRREAVAGRERR
jgi:hypothetical protein